MKKETLTSSFIYKMLERLGVKGFGLVVSIILARLLSPDDFGQIAIITVFINLSQTFIQSGLNTALVQSKDTTEDDYSTVFYISLAISIICIGVLYLIAPWIGMYYQIDGLSIQLRFYSIVLLFGAFNSVQTAKMQKEMHFRKTMICSLIATIMSGTLGIIMAYAGTGIWALIIYYMTNTIFASVTMFMAEHWYPKLVFSYIRAKKLFSYGWRMLVSAFLCTLYTDIRSLIVGKKYSSEDLGYYNRGQQFPEIISGTIDTTIQSVMFPTLSEVQDQIERLKQLLRVAVKVGMFAVAPAMLGLAALSDRIVHILLTDKWAPCVIYMQLMCIGNASIPIQSSNLVALKSTGRSDVYMRLEMVRRISMLVILLVSIFAFDSVLAIAIGYAISMWVDIIIIVLCTRKYLKYGFTEHIADLTKTIIASIVMSLTVYFIGMVLPVNFWTLCLEIGIGVCVYLLMAMMLKNDSITLLINAVKKK